MAQSDTEQSRYWFSIGAIAIGIVASATLVGAVIGIPLLLIGVGVFLHTWWKDFDDAESSEGSSPA